MHMAVRSGKKRVVQLLINYGASLDVPGPDGTPEQSAVKYGFPDIADLLRFCRTSPQEKLAPRKKHHKKMKKKISGKESTSSIRGLFSIQFSNIRFSVDFRKSKENKFI
jgi:hypothetical protein